MGEVYRARDTKLGRDVALKVLPQAFAADRMRLGRFEREAHLLASLNHPNIASIYGFEESGNVEALVMELVEGRTLEERIALAPGSSPASASLKAGATPAPRTPQLPLDEALPIAKQVAGALEYAHERGIIHRDLKPSNIKLTPEDTVKVLDFGLAKALDPASSPQSDTQLQNSPTISAMATQVGIIMGTAAYMSPEQARGKTVDRRADIWAFGCVLYEMLTGKRAFEGETVSDVLAAVITKDPDWNALPESIPASIRTLLRRCLDKDPKRRLQAVGEARIAIEETLEGDAGAELALPAGAQQSARLPPRRRALPWLIVGGLMLFAGIAAGWWVSARRIPHGSAWSAQMLGGPSIAMGPRISPDGHTLAFQAMVDGLTQAAVMDTNSGDWRVLTTDRSRGYITEMNWSPDGSDIYFDRYLGSPNGIYEVSRLGGDAHLVLKDAMAPEPLPDGSLVAIRVNKERTYQLYRFWPDSGRIEALDALPLGWGGVSPLRAFRDGKAIVFLGETLEQRRTDPSPNLYILNLASGRARRLTAAFSPATASFNLIPIAIASDDQSVLVDSEAGDLHRIISIPRQGAGPIRTLFSLTLAPAFMDADKRGNVYMDQVDRPLEVFRFPAAGGTPEALVGPQNASADYYQVFQLPDGRMVFDTMAAGRSHLVAAGLGSEALPFIQTKDETSFPACRIGDSEIALLLGAPGHKVVAEASLANGQIVRRLDAIPGNEITDLAGSPDGRTLYYVASGTIWAIGASGGQPHQIGPGDAVAPNPNGKDIIVQLNDPEGVRFFSVPVSGGAEVPIPIQSVLRPSTSLLSANAVGKDGRVVVSLSVPDSWFVGVGILDPRSGRLERIPLQFTGDVIAPGWLNDGRIFSSFWPLRSTLWRFHPVAQGPQ